MTWSFCKYIHSSNLIERNEEERNGTEQLNSLIQYIKRYSENYVITFNYYPFIAIITYGKKLVDNEMVKNILDVISYEQELSKILLSDEDVIIEGFPTIMKNIEVQ